MTVVACMKWVASGVVVDPLDATVTTDARSWGASPADRAGLELALLVGQRCSEPVTVVCVGPAAADELLRDATALGADRVIRVDTGSTAQAGSADVARLLAAQARDASLVICGDHSLDRGSGSTPAFLAAELGVPQVLGVAALEFGSDLAAIRRTDRGGRDRISVPARCVLSVDGSLHIDGEPTRIRRAALPAVVASATSIVEVIDSPTNATPTGEVRPFRPRPRLVTGPDPAAEPLDRIAQLTDTFSDRTPPRTLRLDPSDAAAAILDHLANWGYLDDTEP